MLESGDTFLSRLWFLIIAILISANLILVTLHLSTTAAISTDTTTSSSNKSDNSIAAAIHLNVVSNKFGHSMDLAGHTISSSGRSVAMVASHNVMFIGHTAQNGAAAAGRSVIGGMASMASATGHIVESVTNPVIVSALITPADKTSVPVINAPPALPVQQTVNQPAPQTSPIQTASAAQWPIHGVITTQFGVPELPYERIHTGLDISDGRSPGNTPIMPFKPGVVSEVVRSSFGLGNHIILDHGGGMTSVYGHLYSISVQVGQQVQENTTLGYEGSTGASTGIHLHFEIRINGQPKDPQKFINGHP